MLHRIEGVGLPNVFLRSGFTLEGSGDAETVAYANLDGLYRAIGRSVARRAAPLTGAEFRFLRRRLGMSQEQAGSVLGKTAQAVAKWEKGHGPVPTADGKLLRMAWLGRFSRRDLGAAVDAMIRASDYVPAGYVFAFGGNSWTDVSHELFVATIENARSEATSAIGKARFTSMGYASTTSAGTVVVNLGNLRSREDRTT